MPDPYVDEDGQPRFGVRVSPEELERIRREQGIDTPSEESAKDPDRRARRRSSRESVQASGQETGQEPAPARRRGRHAAPEAPQANQPRYGATAPESEANPYATPTPPATPASPQPSRTSQARGLAPSGIAAAPEGGWSWQQPGAVGHNPRAMRRASLPGSLKPKRRWRLFLVGLLLMIVVPIALGVGAISSVVEGSLAKGAVLTSTGEVYLEADSPVGLYSAYTGNGATQCAATAPSGTKEAITTPDEVAASNTGGATLPYASFTPAESGTYTITCEGGTNGIIVGPALKLDRVGLAGGLIFAAAGCGFLGFIVTIAGIVRLVRSPR